MLALVTRNSLLYIYSYSRSTNDLHNYDPHCSVTRYKNRKNNSQLKSVVISLSKQWFIGGAATRTRLRNFVASDMLASLLPKEEVW